MRFAAALAGKLDAPAGTADTGNGQALRRNTADPPPGYRGGRQRQRILIASPPTLQHQRGGAFFLCGKLKPAGGSHSEAAHFSNHRGKPAMMKAFFHHGQNIFIAMAFRPEQYSGAKPYLRQGRCEQIPASQRPKHRSAAACAPCRYSSDEQGRGRIFIEGGARAGYFVQRAKGKTRSAEPLIHFGYPKRKIFPLLIPPDGLDHTDLGAQCVEPLKTGR